MEIEASGYTWRTRMRGLGTNQFLTILGSCPTTLMVKVSGSAYHDTKKMAPVINTVEMINCLFSVGSISFTPLMVKMSVANKVVSRHTRIPAALMRSGKHMATKFLSVPKEDSDEITKAAQVDSAKDPNKSAPIPAISPTLSPTLSAITCNAHTRSLSLNHLNSHIRTTLDTTTSIPDRNPESFCEFTWLQKVENKISAFSASVCFWFINSQSRHASFHI